MSNILTRERGLADALAGRPSESEYRLVNGLPEHQYGYTEYREGYVEGLRRREGALSPPAQKGPPAVRAPTHRSRSDRAADVMMLALVAAFLWPLAVALLGVLASLVGIEVSQEARVWGVVLGPPLLILAGQIVGSWWELGISGPLGVALYYIGLPILLMLAGLAVFLLIEWWPLWLALAAVLSTLRERYRRSREASAVR